MVKVKIYDQFRDAFRTSKMELFAKIINGFKQLTIFAKGLTSDTQQGYEWASPVLI